MKAANKIHKEGDANLLNALEMARFDYFEIIYSFSTFSND